MFKESTGCESINANINFICALYLVHKHKLTPRTSCDNLQGSSEIPPRNIPSSWNNNGGIKLDR